MVIQNPLSIKEKITSFISRRGPSLPVHVAKEIQLSMLFASAFLSELISDRKVKISKMKVGGSPLYFLPGQEKMLENFSNFLGSKEKEAFQLLKEKKFLKDSELEPAIRVALRDLKDFAFAFNFEDELYWKYLTAEETDFKRPIQEKITEDKKIEEEKQENAKKETNKQEEKIINIKQPDNNKPVKEKEVINNLEEGNNTSLKKEEKLDIFDKKQKQQKIIKAPKRKNKKEKTKKQEETFFNKVKEALNKKEIEILDILGISKNEIILKTEENNEEIILFALNTKKITEKELIKASKKSEEFNLKYSILSFGELQKKTKDIVEASKNLKNVEKI